MGTAAEHQAANVTPPRRGAVIALAVDATARAYDITDLTLGGVKPDDDNKRSTHVYVTLQAITADVFFYFADGAAAADVDDVDDTAAITAGNALAFANGYAAVLEASEPPQRFRIDRARDKFLVVKTASGTARVILWASSEGF